MRQQKTDVQVLQIHEALFGSFWIPFEKVFGASLGWVWRLHLDLFRSFQEALAAL